MNMESKSTVGSTGRGTVRFLRPLLGATLITSAIHFADNAFRLDLYPGPASLTRNGVLLAWLLLPLLAWLAYRSNSRAALIAYATLGFAGFAHYLALGHANTTHEHGMPLRCAITIFSEAIASAVLIACVLLNPDLKFPKKLSDQ